MFEAENVLRVERETEKAASVSELCFYRGKFNEVFQHEWFYDYYPRCLLSYRMKPRHKTRPMRTIKILTTLLWKGGGLSTMVWFVLHTQRPQVRFSARFAVVHNFLHVYAKNFHPLLVVHGW